MERPNGLALLWIKLFKGSEDPQKYFTIQNISEVTAEDFSRLASERLGKAKHFKKEAFVFVHGFNVTFEEALFSTAQIVWDIQFDGLACLYSWPSKGNLEDYIYDSNSALQSRSVLADFLRIVQLIPSIEQINIIAHSMGSVSIIEAMRNNLLNGQSKKIDQLIFAAPDIDRDNFLSLATQIESYASNVTIYASSNDRALIASKRIASNIPRAGDVPEDGPVVLPSSDSIDASAVSNGFFSINHSYFASDRTVMSDIGTLLETGMRPPSARNPTIRSVSKKSGESYWKFPE